MTKYTVLVSEAWSGFHYLWPAVDEELSVGVCLDLVHLPVLDPVPQTHTSRGEQTYIDNKDSFMMNLAPKIPKLQNDQEDQHSV